eukprot:Pgem_evm1s1413
MTSLVIDSDDDNDGKMKVHRMEKPTSVTIGPQNSGISFNSDQSNKHKSSPNHNHNNYHNP